MKALDDEGTLQPLASMRCLILKTVNHCDLFTRVLSALQRMLMMDVKSVQEAPVVELCLLDLNNHDGETISQPEARVQLGAMVRSVGEAWAMAGLPGTTTSAHGRLVLPPVNLYCPPGNNTSLPSP